MLDHNKNPSPPPRPEERRPDVVPTHAMTERG